MNMVDHLSGPLAGIASRVGADVSKLDAAVDLVALAVRAARAVNSATPSSDRDEMPLLMS